MAGAFLGLQQSTHLSFLAVDAGTRGCIFSVVSAEGVRTLHPGQVVMHVIRKQEMFELEVFSKIRPESR